MLFLDLKYTFVRRYGITEIELHPTEIVGLILKDCGPRTVVLKKGTVFYILNGYYHVLPQ